MNKTLDIIMHGALGIIVPCTFQGIKLDKETNIERRRNKKKNQHAGLILGIATDIITYGIYYIAWRLNHTDPGSYTWSEEGTQHTRDLATPEFLATKAGLHYVAGGLRVLASAIMRSEYHDQIEENERRRRAIFDPKSIV